MLLLHVEAVDLEMTVVREKRPDDAVETLAAGTGRVEPVRGRGSVRYDLAGLFTPPGTTPAPTSSSIVEVIWTPDDLYVRIPGGQEREWQSRPRDQARTGGGLVGRLPDEAMGLVILVAQSGPEHAAPLDGAEVDGALAERWLVRVPVDVAVREGVPADTPDADVVRGTYSVSDVEIEAWLVDGALRRLRYAFAREEAPYGGPDRTTTTYDWRPAAAGGPITVPM